MSRIIFFFLGRKSGVWGITHLIWNWLLVPRWSRSWLRQATSKAIVSMEPSNLLSPPCCRTEIKEKTDKWHARCQPSQCGPIWYCRWYIPVYRVHRSSEAQCVSTKGLGCTSNNFNNKASTYIPMVYTCIYMIQDPCGPLFTRKQQLAYVRWPNRPKYKLRFYCFLNSFCISYQAFGINLPIS